MSASLPSSTSSTARDRSRAWCGVSGACAASGVFGAAAAPFGAGAGPPRPRARPTPRAPPRRRSRRDGPLRATRRARPPSPRPPRLPTAATRGRSRSPPWTARGRARRANHRVRATAAAARGQRDRTRGLGRTAGGSRRGTDRRRVPGAEAPPRSCHESCRGRRTTPASTRAPRGQPRSAAGSGRHRWSRATRPDPLMASTLSGVRSKGPVAAIGPPHVPNGNGSPSIVP